MKNDDKLIEYDQVFVIIKKLEDLAEVDKIKSNYDKEKKNKSIKILEYCILFATKQFGERIIGSSYRKQRVDSTVSNYSVDFGFLIPIYQSLCDLYFPINNTIPDFNTYNISDINCSKAIKCFDTLLAILTYWNSERKLNKNERYEVYDESDYLANSLNTTYFRYGICKQYQKRFDEALKYYDASIYYGNQTTVTEEDLEKLRLCLTIEGKKIYNETKHIYEVKLDRLCMCLTLKGLCLYTTLKFDKVKIIFEEIYIIMSSAYFPDHPKVLDKVKFLVAILIEMKEYIDAERYARVCYECLLKNDSDILELSTIANLLAVVTFELIKQNTSNTSKKINLINIEDVGKLFINSLKIQLKYNTTNIDCGHIQKIKNSLYELYTFMGKNKVEILTLFDANEIYYSISGEFKNNN
jgi:tetratricopeptide (TPR) repeat protein